MHGQQTFSAQALASMDWSKQRRTWPADGVDDPGGTAVLSRCPSHASTVTQALVDVETGNIYDVPKWKDYECSAGVWRDTTSGDGDKTRGDGDTTRGDGDAEVMEGPVSHGHGGTFGLITCNWGGHWEKADLEEHMNNDLRTSVCAVIAVQEAEQKCLEFMNEPIRGGNGQGKGGWALDDPAFLGIRGQELRDTSLVIAARPSIVLGIRLSVFERHVDGTYLHQKKVKTAVSKIMIAALKMRYLRILGEGGTLTDELAIANVHLSSKTAKKDSGLRGQAVALKAFYDRLATYVMRFGARLMVGDWNMQLFSVIPEMRARGFEISLAAWFPFHFGKEAENRSDSCGIFTIGPWPRVRIAFDQAVFGMVPAARSAANSMVMEVIKDDAGREVSKTPYEVEELYDKKCQGYALSCYMPKVDATKAKYVDMTFDVQVSTDTQQAAVNEVRETMRTKATATPQLCVDFTTGEGSWDWSSTLECKQKPSRSVKFDPMQEFSKRGAHRTLMVYIGERGKTRRTPASRTNRASKADQRGYTSEIRTPWLHDGSKGNGGKARGGRGKGSKGGETTRGGGGKAGATTAFTQIAGPRDPEAQEWSASSWNWNSWTWS